MPQGTCLVLLNSLLISDDDNDYLRTIVRIPSEPLLAFLEPTEGQHSDVDSGFDTQRDLSLSVTTHSSSDDQAPKPFDGTQQMHLLHLPTSPYKERAISSASDSSFSRSAVSPSLQGQFVTQAEARRIVLKMLAVCSTHHKMKASLSDHRTLSLLVDYLSDPSQENVTNAIIALANVAQTVNSHSYLIQINIADKLKPLLDAGPR